MPENADRAIAPAPLDESSAAPADLARRPLWTCPRCGNAFANENNSHSCVAVPLEAHFQRRPQARRVFDAFRAAVEAEGHVTLVSSKGRIAFMTRVRFAAVYQRATGIRVHFWLRRRAESARFVRVDHLPPGNWIHFVDLHAPEDVDDEIVSLIREARLIGDQRHHRLY